MPDAIPGAEIAHLLARHGVTATAARTVSGGDVGDGIALLNHAADAGAPLLALPGSAPGGLSAEEAAPRLLERCGLYISRLLLADGPCPAEERAEDTPPAGADPDSPGLNTRHKRRLAIPRVPRAGRWHFVFRKIVLVSAEWLKNEKLRMRNGRTDTPA